MHPIAVVGNGAAIQAASMVSGTVGAALSPGKKSPGGHCLQEVQMSNAWLLLREFLVS